MQDDGSYKCTTGDENLTSATYSGYNSTSNLIEVVANGSATGMIKELLWKNDPNTRTYGAQTLNLNTDLTKYTAIIVETTSASVGRGVSTVYLSNDNNYDSYAGGNSVTRRIYRISNTSIKFDDAYRGGTTDNYNIIPMKIYGVKMSSSVIIDSKDLKTQTITIPNRGDGRPYTTQTVDLVFDELSVVIGIKEVSSYNIGNNRDLVGSITITPDSNKVTVIRAGYNGNYTNITAIGY